MTQALCLKCRYYAPFVQYYSDYPIDHVISTAWRCEKGLEPKEGMDEAGNVVAMYCNDYEVRHGADTIS